VVQVLRVKSRKRKLQKGKAAELGERESAAQWGDSPGGKQVEKLTSKPEGCRQEKRKKLDQGGAESQEGWLVFREENGTFD